MKSEKIQTVLRCIEALVAVLALVVWPLKADDFHLLTRAAATGLSAFGILAGIMCAVGAIRTQPNRTRLNNLRTTTPLPELQKAEMERLRHLAANAD